MTRTPLAPIATALFLAAATPALADQVQYRVTFEADWSATTHPVNFPGGAHFSGLVGATHHHGVHFWRRGELASTGIEVMAETGSKGQLLLEVSGALRDDTAFSRLSGPTIPNSPGQTVYTFTVDARFPLVTLVSMIAPSPDWFVGTDSLNLFENGVWQDDLVVDLAPYDAGTDSGIFYTSGNQDTNPAQPVDRLNGTTPFIGTPPIGTYTFEIIDGQTLCPLDLDNDDQVAIGDLLIFLVDFFNADPRAERTGDDEIGVLDLLNYLTGYFSSLGACP